MKTIEEILATDDLHRERVPVPVWGTEVLVVSMTGEERADIEKRWSGRNSAQADPAGFRADVLARTMKNEDGSPFGTPEQIRKLLAKNAAAVERVFEAACRVSALSQADVTALEGN